MTDKKKLIISKKIYNACKPLCKEVKLVLIPIGKYDGNEPPKRIANLMEKYDIVIAPTTHSITHAKATMRASKKGVRIATMPGITDTMLSTALLANSKELNRLGNRIKNVLEKGKKVRVTTPLGTNISFSIEKRKVFNDDGDLSDKGDVGNLPDGEVYLSPVEGTANGIIVIDIMSHYSKGKTKVHVKKGFAVDISDEKCELAKIFKTIKNSKNIAEFGIGTNKKARILGDILNDEKVLGTCHIAFGNNTDFGGKIYSEVHLDTVLRKPTVIVDGKTLIKDGKILL